MARHGSCEHDPSHSAQGKLEEARMEGGSSRCVDRGGYSAWLLIPLVVKSDFAPHFKTALIAVLGATPLLTKFAAVALFGSEAINFLKRHMGKLWQRDGS